MLEEYEVEKKKNFFGQTVYTVKKKPSVLGMIIGTPFVLMFLAMMLMTDKELSPEEKAKIKQQQAVHAAHIKEFKKLAKSATIDLNNGNVEGAVSKLSSYLHYTDEYSTKEKHFSWRDEKIQKESKILAAVAGYHNLSVADFKKGLPEQSYQNIVKKKKLTFDDLYDIQYRVKNVVLIEEKPDHPFHKVLADKVSKLVKENKREIASVRGFE